MQRFSILLSAIVFFAMASANAQSTDGLVKGKIINAANGEAFSNVNVALYSMPDTILVTGTATDPEGFFKVEKVNWGNYLLVARFVGFTPVGREVSLSSENPLYDAGEITMTESAQELDGVEIVTAKPEVMYQEGKKILNVDQYKNSGASNLVEVLENAPSITTDTEGNVLLRGSSNYVLLIDGKPAPMTGTNLLRQGSIP